MVLEQVLAPTWMDLVELGVKRNLRNPGPYFQHHYEGTPRAFIDDYCNYAAIPEYQMLVECSPIAHIVASVLGTERLWLFYDQIFIKDAPDGQARRTPWHQDTTYWMTGGSQIAGFWITLDDTPAGSHWSSSGVRTAARPTPARRSTPTTRPRPTLPARDPYERIPDIEADRASFDIVAFDVTRGDVILFHPGLLHGGGSALEGKGRRTLSLRFFGEDVVYKEQPRPAPTYPGISALVAAGEPLRGPWFPQVHPPAPRRTSTASAG